MSYPTDRAAAEAFAADLREKAIAARQEVVALESQLRVAEEMIDFIKSNGPTESPGSTNNTLRPGSMMDQTYRVLLDAGKPLHISEIAKRIGLEDTPASRRSLVSSISRYVRMGQVFTRPKPSTFGLMPSGHEAVPPLPNGSGGNHGEEERTPAAE